MPSFSRAAAAAAGLFASTVSANFNPASSTNVALYWGQGYAQIPLSEVCSDDSVDIVNIAFVNQFPKTVGDYPSSDFANACGAEYYTKPDGTKSGLLSNCPGIGPGIKVCHDNGKKVLLSLGGGTPRDYYLPNKAVAEYFAEFLWGAFGPQTDEWVTAGKPRPFGDAAVDGFDLDIESYMVTPPFPEYLYANYDYFVKKLKNDLFPTGPGQYYISGAPQCDIPDARLADAISKSHFDFIFVQFYNTPLCSTRAGYNGLSTFTFDKWVTWLKTNSFNKNTKIYLGMPANTDGAPSDPTSYLTPKEANQLIGTYSKKHADIFGGIMLWEATVSSRNQICSKGYSSWIKDILTGKNGGTSFTQVCPSSSSSIASSTSTLASSTSSSAIATPTAKSPDGSCGSSKGYTCIGYHMGECCSQRGQCGGDAAYCGTGCQTGFGKCGLSSSSSSTSSTSPLASSLSSSVSPSASSTASSSVFSTSRSSSVPSTSSLPSSVISSSASSSSATSHVSSDVSSSSTHVPYPTGGNSTSVPYPTGGSSSVPYPTGSDSSVPNPTGASSTNYSSSLVYPTKSGSTLVYPTDVSSTGIYPTVSYPTYNASTTVGPTEYPHSTQSPSTLCSTGEGYETSSSSSAYPVYPESTTAEGHPGSPSTSCSTSGKAYPTASSSVEYPTYPESSSSEGYPEYPASSSSKDYPGYPVPSSSSEGYPSYPSTTAKPSQPLTHYPPSEETTTVITTTYVDICPTGLTTITTTITKTMCPQCEHKPTDVPEGWTTTVTVCGHCGPKTTTVTLTKPIDYPTTIPQYPAPSRPVPESSLAPQHSGPTYVPGKPQPETAEEETATSTIYQYVTLTLVPVPGTETPAPYVPANSTYVHVPTGTASSTGKGAYYAYTPVPFEGAASRFGVGLSVVAVLVAGILVL